jgi:hypothetical protein
MAVWLNMKDQEAELCASMAEGVKKLQAMLGKRAGEGGRVTPLNLTIQLNVRYRVASYKHGAEEFWLSDEPESKKPSQSGSAQ